MNTWAWAWDNVACNRDHQFQAALWPAQNGQIKFISDRYISYKSRSTEDV